jgi:hypothetical protein
MSTPGPTDSEYPEEEEQAPASWVNEYLQAEEQVKESLERAREYKLRNEHRKARKILEDLALSRHNSYRVVELSVTNNEEFLDDVKNQMGEDTHEILISLQDNYSDFTDELQLVDALTGSRRKNIPSSGSVTIDYAPESQRPVVDYTLYSHDVELFNMRAETGFILHTSMLFLDAAANSLDSAIDNDLSVNDQEIKQIISIYESMQSRMEDISDATESLKKAEDID